MLRHSPRRCEICHTINSRLEVDSYNHSVKGFSLDGRNRGVECDKCRLPAGAAKKDIVCKASGAGAILRLSPGIPPRYFPAATDPEQQEANHD